MVGWRKRQSGEVLGMVFGIYRRTLGWLYFEHYGFWATLFPVDLAMAERPKPQE